MNHYYVGFAAIGFNAGMFIGLFIGRWAYRPEPDKCP